MRPGLIASLRRSPRSTAHKHARTIVNLQGDLPTLDPADLRAAIALLADPAVDVATLAAEISKPQERTNPNVVKVIGSRLAPDRMRALYFTRATAPHGEGPLYHHIGLYAYRRAALERFVALPPSDWSVAKSSSSCG